MASKKAKAGKGKSKKLPVPPRRNAKSAKAPQLKLGKGKNPKKAKERKRAADAARPGDNGGPGAMTSDERAALHFSHVRKFQAAKGDVDDARKELNRIKKLIQKEGGSVKQCEITILLQTEDGEKAFRARIESELQVAEWNGVGVQLGLFGEVDRTPAADRHFADGKRAGLKAERRTPPNQVPQIHHNDWLSGYDVGQEANQQAFIKQATPIEQAAAAPAQTNGDASRDGPLPTAPVLDTPVSDRIEQADA